MIKSDLEFLQCPSCFGTLDLQESEYADNEVKTGKLYCKKCKQEYQIVNFIPQLFIEENISKRDLFFSQQADDYSRYYSALLKFFGFLMFSWEPRVRKKFLQKQGIKEGSKILDICTGPGNNLPPLKKYVKRNGKLVAIDLSEKMTIKCRKIMKRKKIPVSVHRGNGLELPYIDNYFDVAISSGGINLFDDREKGVNEMIRVTKPGGIVLITDEGLEPEFQKKWLGKQLIKMNNLFTMKPPTDELPKDLEYETGYYSKDTMYYLKFRVQ